MHRLPFSKLSGAGNDFIVLHERDCTGLDPAWIAQRLCTRALSLGADGVILVDPDAPDAIRVRFFNSDRSAAELCGNGSRCAARFALEHTLVTTDRFVLVTDAGDLAVAVHPGGRFEVAMPEPECIHLHHFDDELDEQPVTVHSLRVGVPHAVVVVPDVAAILESQLLDFTRRLRSDRRFPEGANVNVISLDRDGPVRLRTYERGVEGLTLACGTGSTASAFVAHEVYRRAWPVDLAVDGGRLTIDEHQGKLWLIGDARLIATGFVEPEALNW